MCVILGAPNTAEKVPDPTLLDKSVVLATLNVRAMRFSKDEGKVVSDDDEADNKLIQSKSVLDVPGQGTLSKQLSLQRIPSVRSTPNRSSGYDIPIITDLIRDSNAMFLDDEDTDLPGTEFYQTQPYASGRAFAASVLDLLMITSFFNPTITKVIHTIIFGGASLELERIMAEGAGLIGGPNISKQAEIKDQVSIVQESVEGSPLSIHAGSSYGGLFVDALCSMGLVVLGLYRRIDDVSPKRYVICNPPEAFKVRPDDLVFALKRAFWQWQPPLKTSRQTSRNRIIDLDVKSLEAKLKTLNEDVTNVREEYQGLILTVEGESADAVTPNEPDAETPLLPKDTGPISPLRKTSNVVEKKRVEDDLKVLETKLAAIKHDVAIMQARYLNFLNSS